MFATFSNIRAYDYLKAINGLTAQVASIALQTCIVKIRWISSDANEVMTSNEFDMKGFELIRENNFSKEKSL